MKTIDFDTLIGSKAKLYNYVNDIYAFQLGSVLFEVVEDPNDGYRSSMEEVRILSDGNKKVSKDFLGDVIIEACPDADFDGYILRDVANGHTWLKFGTDNSDSYYPSFTFEWNGPEQIIDDIKSKINN